MANEESAATATATLPRLAALVRLLLQLRMLLAAIALLIAPSDRQNLSTVLTVIAFALLSALVARYWERFVPYLLRHPLLTALDVCVASAILVIDGPSGPIFLGTLLTATIVGLLFGWRGIAAGSALQVLCYAGALFAFIGMNQDVPPIEITTFQILLVNPVLYPVAGYVGLRIGSILTELYAEQEARRAAELTAAAANERNRLARDMHDSVAKTLRGAAMAAQALPIWITKNPERAATTASQVVDAAERAAEEARALISGLRDSDSAASFGQAVADVVSEWKSESGINTEIHGGDTTLEPSLNARYESVAILKEALTNIERHANASNVVVALSEENQFCVLTITDDGQGFDTSPDTVRETEQNGNGHFGLLGMTERAKRFGGTLRIDSVPDNGASVSIRIPATLATESASEGIL